MSVKFDDVIAAYEFLKKELPKSQFDDLTLCRVKEGMFDCFVEDRGLLLKKSGADLNVVCTIDGFEEIAGKLLVRFKPITASDDAETFLVGFDETESGISFVYSGATEFKTLMVAMFPGIYNVNDLKSADNLNEAWLYFTELLTNSDQLEAAEEKKHIESKSEGRAGFGLFA